jgi:hypothetical protein
MEAMTPEERAADIAAKADECCYRGRGWEASIRLLALRHLTETAAETASMRAALTSLLRRHCRLVESGDCGFWNVEEEEEVIAARRALTGTTAD